MIRIVNINGHIDFSNENDLIDYANYLFYRNHGLTKTKWATKEGAIFYLENECGWTYDTLTAYIWGNRKESTE